MKHLTYNLADFSENPELIGELQVLFTVKSFNLQAIRERYLQSRKRSRTGSVERRKPAEGGLVLARISQGKMQHQEILAHIVEARGIDVHQDRLAASSDNIIYVFTQDKTEPEIIEHNWFSYIHTVKWSADDSRLLVTSSGVDTIMELSSDQWEILWEWNAWEHGFNTGRDPRTNQEHTLTRSPREAERLERQGKRVILVIDPQTEPLPTALRAAFINSAEYGDHGEIIATFFHEGEVRAINKETAESSTLIDGLTKPHGGMPFQHGYLVTDTAGGRVLYPGPERIEQYSFEGLPGKSEAVKDLEWLQTSHHYDTMLLTIDANRSALICFDPEKREKMTVPFNPDWAVQDFVVLTSNQMPLAEQVGHWFRQMNKEQRET